MSLAIRRLRNVFSAASDLPRREEVCARIESSVRQAGVDQLSRTLDEALDPADPSVWIIRRLRVSFAIGEPKQSETAWAKGIAFAVRRRIELGPDGQNTLRFPDRASYWAWFLRDRASGSGSRWWYEPLESLMHLGFGAACVTLLSRQVDHAAPVLGLLEEWGVWESVVRQLSEEQATRLLDWIGPAEPLPPSSLLPAAADVWDWAVVTGGESVKTRLSAVLRLRRKFPDAPVPSIRAAVETIAEAETVFHSMPLQEWVRFVAQQWSALPGGRAPATLPPRVSLLFRHVPGESLNQLVQVWESRTKEHKLVPRDSQLTEFGGWFLLLPFYLSLGVDALVEENDRPALRWLLARMCMGPRGRRSAADDPGLLWAAGLDRPPAIDQLRAPSAGSEWTEEADPEYFGSEPLERAWGSVAAAIIRKFARRLPGFGRSSPVHLDANIFSGRTSLELSPGHAQVCFDHRPLDILLRMGGFAGDSYLLPWRDYATVTIRLA